MIDISYLFQGSPFNPEIFQWNTSKVNNMNRVFAHSKFNNGISKWNTSNVVDMSYMFFDSKFNNHILFWDTSNVINMDEIFSNSKFDGDIGMWNTSKVANIDDILKKWEEAKINNMYSKTIVQIKIISNRLKGGNENLITKINEIQKAIETKDFQSKDIDFKLSVINFINEDLSFVLPVFNNTNNQKQVNDIALRILGDMVSYIKSDLINHIKEEHEKKLILNINENKKAFYDVRNYKSYKIQ